jgi:hypothetical protein
MSTAFAVAAAVAASICYAVAAALEQHQAESDTSRRVTDPRLLLDLARRPRWVLGFGVGVGGAALHMTALALAPLTLVQPIGVGTVIFAVPLGAALRHRRPHRREVAASLVLAAGLATGMSLIRSERTPIHPSASALIIVAATAIGLAAVAALTAKVARPAVAAPVLAAAAAVLLGGGSALAGTLLHTDGVAGTLTDPQAAVVAAAVAAGAVLEQGAYKTGRLAPVVAIMTVLDPLACIGLGWFALGQPVDIQIPALAAVAGVIIAASTVVLSRGLHAPEARPTPRRPTTARPISAPAQPHARLDAGQRAVAEHHLAIDQHVVHT